MSVIKMGCNIMICQLRNSVTCMGLPLKCGNHYLLMMNGKFFCMTVTDKDVLTFVGDIYEATEKTW